jgi:recombination protein RecA
LKENPEISKEIEARVREKLGVNTGSVISPKEEADA